MEWVDTIVIEVVFRFFILEISLSKYYTVPIGYNLYSLICYYLYPILNTRLYDTKL